MAIPKNIQDFLTQYPLEIIIKQHEQQECYFNAPEFEQYMNAQLGCDINYIEVVDYKYELVINFYDINEDIQFTTTIKKTLQ